MRKLTSSEAARWIFPLTVGVFTPPSTVSGSRLAGTAFFVSRGGLACTAAHVLKSVDPATHKVFAAIGDSGERARACPISAPLYLPSSDIAVFRVNAAPRGYLPIDFRAPMLGSDIETIGVPDWMTTSTGDGGIVLENRWLKGYVSFRTRAHIEASFSLPKGMSGAPAFTTSEDGGRVVCGVMVGQSRGSQLEDMHEEIVQETPDRVRVERTRIDRIEYFAKADLFAPHADFKNESMNGSTLKDVIEADSAATFIG